MNPTDIEKTLKKIIDIDEKAELVEDEIVSIKYEKDKAIKKEMRELDLSMMKKARRLGKIERELILKEANEEIERIQKESQHTCQRMQELSDHHLKTLIDEVFQELIGKKIQARR